MKAVIPVAGMGARLRPHTHTQPKALVPIAGKAILGHIIERLQAAGVTQFVLVVGYLGEKIMHYVQRKYPHIHAEFVVQQPREGLGHALWWARETFRHEKNVLIQLGDTIVDVDMEEFFSSEHTMLAVKPVKNPTMFGIAEMDNSGFITKVIEKPKIPKSNFALVGLYKIAHPAKLAEALEYIVANDIRTQSEHHLTDALMHMIQNGEKMVSRTVDHWFDCGRKDTLLQANATLLNRPEFKRVEYPDFPNTIIIPPVSIGKGVQISNSIVGPNVAIGESAILNYTIVRNSIIGGYAELGYAVLEDSLVGSDSALKGLSQRLNIGDSTEIDFSH
ncbi:sugar phosphate nucleotidyltransferase [Rufibacter tibetensis]|uniref:Glucose-1-phosphate thymidylyltransferase n=1 Tax=Rufibacter tibetensis TaxID=512763 RepID=A0A0P0CPA9_9BACT|nr:sugar phosphate nucleotidyltransferase [Rufibacter tibetensis]ALI99090.1 glucose-1-phosphate thymidylyltransferase [Rufibacter tibetensis]